MSMTGNVLGTRAFGCLLTSSKSGLRRQYVCMTAVAACLVLGVMPAAAQSSKPGEYEVKAAYLYNFGKFIAWPPRSGAPQAKWFEICVVGQDPFGPALNLTLADEKIDGKRVTVKRVPSAQDATHCQVLFIGLSEEHQLTEILAALDGSTVLTVSDMPQFSRRGGMVQFVLDGSKVRFEINLASAERAGLILSSELLKLAVNVRTNPTPGD